MASSALRIVNDIIEFNKNRPDDIYINVNKSNIYKMHAMIVGPSKTPYYGGYFFFEITFPQNYPSNSPTVKFLTTDGNVRFNPNLYACGKVCLSILGTWPGPKWEPVMSLSSVLLSIQSLMGEIPLRNEPGFENIQVTDIKAQQYTQYVIYSTYKIGIIDVINGNLNSILLNLFNKEIILNLNKNYKNLRDDIMSYAEIYGDIPIVNIFYNLKVKNLDFKNLALEFEKISQTIKID
jgi:ubiquitin-protein ligase